MMRTTIVQFRFSLDFSAKWWKVQFKFKCLPFLTKTKFSWFLNPVSVRSIPLKLRLSTWLIIYCRLHKLEHCRVTGCSLTVFRNYLTARLQTVQYEKELSSSLPLDFRVPLGSLQGPLLFEIEINDLPQCLQHSAINYVWRWHRDVFYWVWYQHHQRKSKRRPQTSREVVHE